jgi:alpha-1,2-mannosyltransferase
MGLVIEGRVTRVTSWLARIPPWPLGGTAAMAWAASLVYAHLGSRFSLDLRVYRAASKSLTGGRNPYQLYFTQYHLPFTYPPAALLAFRPFSLGSVHLVEALWWLVNALAVIAILYRGVRNTLELPRDQTFWLALVFTPVLSLAFEPLRTNTTYGQINVVLLLLT